MRESVNRRWVRLIVFLLLVKNVSVHIAFEQEES